VRWLRWRAAVKEPGENSRVRALRHRRTLSPLTRRFLAVNLIAPVMLLAGLLYLDQYEDALIESDLASLRVQADIIAAAIAESAVSAETITIQGTALPITNHRLEADQARAIVRRLAEIGSVRARVFDPNGLLVADSRRLVGPGGAVQVFDLPEIEPFDLKSAMRASFEIIRQLMRWEKPLPRYHERPQQTAADYDEVIQAIEDGQSNTAVHRLNAEDRLLSASVPIQYYKHVVGAVLVSRPDKEIQASMFDVRWAIGKLFLGTLGITVLLSFYLARAITRPVHRLAAAAERVRSNEAGGQGRADDLPDLSHRDDEIGDLSISLRAMTTALWQRMDAIEHFAADVAHEIKNPLTSMRSAVETVVRTTNPDHQRKLLAILQDDVQRLDRLISDISDASRLDAELSRAQSEIVSLGPLLATLGEVYNTVAEQQAVTVVLSFPDADALEVNGLEDRFVQVLRNLIGNALSFSPKESTLRLAAIRHGGDVIVTVEDQGPGIPAGKENAIFERFYSERPAGEKFGTHSGLGLSISKQIIEAHGGSITASNRHDDTGAVCGACFTVRLPARPQDTSRATARRDRLRKASLQQTDSGG
jgi:two-component system sensor histidine kinase ChvG